MTYDENVLNAIEISAARERHGVKPPTCGYFESTNPTTSGVCEEHERETNAALDHMEADRDRRMGA